MPEIRTYAPVAASRSTLSDRQRMLAQLLAQDGTVGRGGAPAMPAGKAGLGLALGNAALSAVEGMQYKAESDKEAAAKAANTQDLAKYLATMPAGGSSGPARSAATPSSGAPSVATGAGQGYSQSRADIVNLIRKSAAAHGVDPDTAVKVALSEGLNSYTGDGGSSFGPFQLHYGNVSGAGKGNQVGGMGDDFTRATGLDARDPSTVPQQIDFAMAQAAKGGWGPWHGAQRVGIANREGIGGAPASATADADLPAPNATPAGGDGLPGGASVRDELMKAWDAQTAPGLDTAMGQPMPPRIHGASLDPTIQGVAAAQQAGNPSLTGAPSPYGIIPPGTGDVAAQSLPTALAPFNSQPTPAGTMTPNSGAPLPDPAQPSLQAGTTVGDVPTSVRDAANNVMDAQAAGMPSFTGLPDTNGHRIALSNSPDMGMPAAPPAPQMAGADVPLPPVRPNQAMIDYLASGATSGADPTSTGSTAPQVSTSPTPQPDMPAPNAVPAMGQGLPGDLTADGPGGGFSPIGKNANFETPQAFNAAQSGGTPMGNFLAGMGGDQQPAIPPPGSVGPGSAFRNVMDGGDIQQTAAQQYAKILENPDDPTVIPAPAGAPGGSDRTQLLARLLADPNTPPPVSQMIMNELQPKPQSHHWGLSPDGTMMFDSDTGATQPSGMSKPVAWQNMSRPDGSIVAINPQTQEMRTIAGPVAKDADPKWQVLGEDQYGNKQYGYPPAPGQQPQGQGAAQPVQSPDASLQGLQGQALLDQLGKTDPAAASQVKAIVEGRAPYPNGMLLKTPYGQRLSALVTQADPTFEAGNSGARVKVRNDFLAGGPNSPAGQITAGNTAIQHLGHLAEAAGQLGNGQYPAGNWLSQEFQKATGKGEAVTSFNNILGKYVEEATKFYRGSGGTEADIQRDLGNLNSNMSPAQLQAAIRTQADLLQSKVNALQERWHQGMGPLGGDFPIIQKDSQGALDHIYGRNSQQGGQGSAPAQQGASALGVGQSTTMGGFTVRRIK